MSVWLHQSSLHSIINKINYYVKYNIFEILIIILNNFAVVNILHNDYIVNYKMLCNVFVEI